MRKKKKNSVGFHDLEGNHLSIHWNPTYNRFTVGITDSCGRGTISIEMGYEDLRSLFKESEEIMIQNTDIIKEKKFSETKHGGLNHEGKSFCSILGF